MKAELDEIAATRPRNERSSPRSVSFKRRRSTGVTASRRRQSSSSPSFEISWWETLLRQIDASIEEMKAAHSDDHRQLDGCGASPGSLPTTGGSAHCSPCRPYGATAGAIEQLTPQDIAGMDMDTYKKYRSQLLQAANPTSNGGVDGYHTHIGATAPLLQKEIRHASRRQPRWRASCRVRYHRYDSARHGRPLLPVRSRQSATTAPRPWTTRGSATRDPWRPAPR